MTIFKDMKLDQIDSNYILKDIEFQFEVDLKEYKKCLPNVYLVYKDAKSIAVISKSLITPIGLAYILTKKDIVNINLFQNNMWI